MGVASDTSSDGTEAETLPDLLRPGLTLVFVGINPSTYSVERGHYYARPGNLFWRALQESGIVDCPVGPEDDSRLLELGIGFTDMVKRPTRSAGEVAPDEFTYGAVDLLDKLEKHRPRVLCFNGLTGYRSGFDIKANPGAQAGLICGAQVFVLPSTSRRNAHYQWPEILGLFRELKAFVESGG